MICYHHNDIDGRGAAFCLHTFKPSMIEDFASSYIECDYNDKFDKHTEKDDVFILDISISENTYQMLIDTCKTARTVTWIDHHETSIDIIKKYEDQLQKIKNLTYFVSNCASGTALTYSYFHIDQKALVEIRHTGEDERYNIKAEYIYFNNGTDSIINVTAIKTNVKNPIDNYFYTTEIVLPSWVFYIDDYDCWKKLNHNTDMFFLGFDSNDTRIKIENSVDKDSYIFNPIWDSVTEYKNINKYISNGKIINLYIKTRYNRELCDTFEWKYGDTTFLCKNGTGNSWNFADWIKKYPAVILFNYSGKSGLWEYSVYSSDKSNFNCKEFCEKFGGGGHLHASGFSSKNLVFIDNDELKSFDRNGYMFLGGTVESDWRQEFISTWNKEKMNEKYKSIKLFNPIVDDWNEAAQAKEKEIKDNASLNLFVITPDQKGPYSWIEAFESCNNGINTFLAIYDKYNIFDKKYLNSLKMVKKSIENAKGNFKIYSGPDSIYDIVKDAASML